MSTTLTQIRQQFVKLSGRKDLLNDTAITSMYYQKEADFFIQEASKWLDNHVFIDRTRQHYSIDIASGNSRIIIPDVEVIEKVYAQKNNTQIHELEHKDYTWVRDRYRQLISSISNNIPMYWSKGIAELGPNQDALTTANYTDQYTYEWGDTIFSGETIPGTVGRYRATSIVILPPVNQTYTITFVGSFYSKVLYEDTDENIWSSRYPGLLIKAALMQLEGFYRNFEGMKDWDAFLGSDIQGLHFKQAEQEIVGVTQIKG